MGSLSDYSIGAGTSVASVAALSAIPTSGLRRGDLAAVDLTDPGSYEYWAFDPTSTAAVNGNCVLADVALNSANNAGRWQKVNITILSDTPYTARNVVTANVADLTAFTVAGNDGIANVAGDVVLLVAQTATEQNGPYVVGTVNAGVAPLTRPSWWRTGSVQLGGVTINVLAGTVYGVSRWFSADVDTFIVGTDNPQLWPETLSASLTLIAGTVTTNALPIRSAAKVGLAIVRTTANTPNLTVQYGASTVTVGGVGNAVLTVQAQIAAGTINNADISTLQVTVQNR